MVIDNLRNFCFVGFVCYAICITVVASHDSVANSRDPSQHIALAESLLSSGKLAQAANEIEEAVALDFTLSLPLRRSLIAILEKVEADRSGAGQSGLFWMDAFS